METHTFTPTAEEAKAVGSLYSRPAREGYRERPCDSPNKQNVQNKATGKGMKEQTFNKNLR